MKEIEKKNEKFEFYKIILKLKNNILKDVEINKTVEKKKGQKLS